MEEKTISVREALEICLQELKSIWVPVSMTNRVARPIWDVTNKLQDVIKGLEEAEAEEIAAPEEVTENV